MRIDTTGYMDRQSPDTDVKTHLLINGKIHGGRIVKLPGNKTDVDGRSVSGGGSIQFDRVFVFKDSRHQYATEQTFFAIWANKMYWWSGTEWHEVDWNGIDPPNFDKIRFWIDRGELHILGGEEGISAVYQHIDRDPGNGDGYFEDDVGFTGFWFGPEELPVFNADNNFSGYISLGQSYANCLTKDAIHYIMGVFVSKGGQVSTPKKVGMVRIMPNDSSTSHLIIASITIDPQDLDERVEGIDIYCAVGTSQDYEYQLTHLDPWYRKISTPVRERQPGGHIEFDGLDWRFLRRLDINQPYVLHSAKMAATSTTTLTYTVSPGETGYFPNDSLNSLFWLRYKVNTTADWNYVLISDTAHSSTTETITVETAVLENGLSYYAQIVGRWSKTAAAAAKAGVILNLGLKVGVGYNGSGIVITIDGTDLTEGVEWTGAAGWDMSSMFKTAQSIGDAINANITTVEWNPPTFRPGKLWDLFLTAVTPGSAGNSIAVSDDDASVTWWGPTGPGATTLSGGSDTISSGEFNTMNFMWRYDGQEDSDIDERDDPIDTIQPYILTKEDFIQANYAAKQNRRIFRLVGKYLYYSEIDMPSVTPNRNIVVLDITPGEVDMGVVAIRGGLLALHEKSIHLIRMTGEPVSYDAEEGKWNEGCLSHEGIVTIEETVYYPGRDGIKTFTNEPMDLTDKVLRDTYKDLIDSEYSGNNNSYEAIVGAYSKKYNLIVWSFPNSTLTIDDLTVQLLIFDIGKGFFFGESSKTYTYLFEGYKGEIFGVDADGIYELFADTPTESNRLVFETGIITPDMSEILVERLRIVYKGTPTIKLYPDRISTALFSETFSNKTSVGEEDRFTMTHAQELQLRIESPSSTADQEIVKIETKESRVELI